MLSKILLYKQNELINHDFGILLLRELIIPHEYLAKKIFILQPKSIVKDKWVYIFDKNGYMYDLKLNITFQIGLYKNIAKVLPPEVDSFDKIPGESIYNKTSDNKNFLYFNNKKSVIFQSPNLAKIHIKYGSISVL